MPLDRSNVTIASRVMLPVDIVFFGGVGLSFLSTPLSRLRTSPGLAYLDDTVGLRFVGGVFVVAALVLMAALLTHDRRLAKLALSAAAVWMCLFALAMFGAALFSSASWSAWLWPGYVAFGCWASLLSLEARER